MLYLEPTPYIIGLIELIVSRRQGEVAVLFIGQNLSQNWCLDLGKSNIKVLPSGLIGSICILRRWLKSGEYGLLHLAGWGHPVLFSALVLASMQGIPIIMESDTSKNAGVPRWKQAVKRLFYPKLFRIPAMFLPGGSRQVEYLRHYGVPVNRIKVAQMTVDTARISSHIDAMDNDRKASIRASYDIHSDGIVFLYVGRLEPHKGLIELINAFNCISSTENGLAYLLIAGDGSLRNLIEGQTVKRKYIRYAGRLSGSALLDVYAVADVFVLVSRFEPWGLVVNEAMAAGLPVIVSACLGCVDDLVREGETGLVIPANSEEMLVKAIVSLMYDKKLREKMALKARNLIAGWTLDNEANIVLNTWDQILKG